MSISRRRLRFVGVALGALLAACDPCAGTATCHTTERVSYSGRVVDRATGRAAPGTVLTFRRTSGISLVSDTVRAVADPSGFFRLSTDATAPGDVVGVLTVEPPGRPGYSVGDIVMRTSRVAGDGGDLGRLVADPFIMYIVEVHSRLKSLPGALPFANVTFRRTGGIGVDADVISAVTDGSGRFFLAPNPTHAGVLEGELTISGAGLPRTYRVPVQIATRYLDAPIRDVALVNVGASLLWAGDVYRRVTNVRLPDIPVTFERTGGILVDPPSFTTTTNVAGLFAIQPAALAEGELIGDVTVHSPAPYAPVIRRGVRIRTIETDTVQLAVRIGYGPQVSAAMFFRYRTSGEPVAPGAITVFRRTSGVALQRDSFLDTVNAVGASRVELASETVGNVFGDLEIRMGDAYGTETLKGIRLSSLDDDAQIFSGVFLVGRWFPQIAQVIDSATQRAIPGTRVVFRRTSGVAIQPDPFVVTPNPDGYFGIRPQPLADGEVVGDLTFEVPAPYRNLTISGVRLRSSMDDALQFVGSWSLAPNR